MWDIYAIKAQITDKAALTDQTWWMGHNVVTSCTENPYNVP